MYALARLPNRFVAQLVLALLAGCWLPAASAQQDQLMQLALAAGRIAQLAGLDGAVGIAELREQRDAASLLLGELEQAASKGQTSVRFDHEFQRLQRAWRTISTAVDQLSGHAQVLQAASESTAQISEQTLAIASELDQLTQRMVDAKATGAQIYTAGRQVAVLERLLRRSEEVLRGELGTLVAADSMQRSIRLLTLAQQALSEGNADIGIQKIDDQALRETSLDISRQLNDVATAVAALGKAAPALIDAREQSDLIRTELFEFQQSLLVLQLSLR